MKVGRRVGTDAKYIREQFHVVVNNVHDVGHLAFRKEVVRNKETALAELSRRVLGQPLSKEQQTANWAGDLTDEMKAYAALDAYASREIWVRLEASPGKYGAVTNDTKIDTEVAVIAQWIDDDKRTTVATGRLKKKRARSSDIEVLTVFDPYFCYRIDGGQRKLLGDHGETPFTVSIPNRFLCLKDHANWLESLPTLRFYLLIKQAQYKKYLLTTALTKIPCHWRKFRTLSILPSK